MGSQKRSRLRSFSGTENAAKAPTGIAGFDQMTHGGLPRGATTLVFGGPGCGKSVFALQALVNGARRFDEPGIFVAFEERTSRILANASSFGWKLSPRSRDRLFFLDAGLPLAATLAGKFDLSGLLSGLSAKAKALGAQRVVFDGVDVLLSLLDDPVAERTELNRIQEWLAARGLTGILTAKAMAEDPFSQPQYGFAAYLADCAILLSRRYHDAVSEREVSILKYRGSSFAENKSPFLIGPGGIEVAEQSSRARSPRATSQRLSTGVKRLDTMLCGGFFRGSSSLLTGLPGTAKSTLAGAFLEAACRRRERALWVTFDERAEEVVRNLSSIGLRLRRFVDSGHLRFMSALSLSDSAETQLMRIRSAIRDQRASCVVIDPITAFAKSSDPSWAVGVLARFIHWARNEEITLLCTSLSSSNDPRAEGTDLGASTLCDNWIVLSYAQQGGERNRSLTIVKARGTGHSNQVRELILADTGITLADVYEADGDVLMGTMRWEQENLQRNQAQQLKIEAQRRRLQLEHTRAELASKARDLKRELAIAEQELEQVKQTEADRASEWTRRRTERKRHRHADVEVAASAEGGAA